MLFTGIFALLLQSLNTLVLHVSNEKFACSDDNSCDGNILRPFATLNDALDFLPAFVERNKDDLNVKIILPFNDEKLPYLLFGSKEKNDEHYSPFSKLSGNKKKMQDKKFQKEKR